MRVFTMLFDETLSDEFGMKTISMVNKPAIKQMYVALGEQNVEQVFLSEDKKKNTVTGAVLVPDMHIPRINKETQEVYEIKFPAETIELAAQDFMKKNLGQSINIEHSLGVEEVYLTETWIKIDETMDKSNALGIDAPVGSLMVTLKVDNQEVREELIETGLLKGFSIEGHFKSVEEETSNVQLKEEDMKTTKKEKSIIGKIKELIGMPEASESVELESKVAEVSYWYQDVINDTFELGTQIMKKPYDEDGEPYAIGSGEWELEDGTRILTDKQGFIRYVFPDKAAPVAEEVPAPVPAEEPAVESVQASEVAVPVEAEVKPDPSTPNAAPEVETPTAKVEVPAETVAEVAENLEKKEEEEVPLIAHTDAQRPSYTKKPKLKFDHNMTVAERIKANLENNLN